MKKPIMIIWMAPLVVLVLVVAYFLIPNNSSAPSTATGEYMTMSELEAFCGLDKKIYSCDESIPCEGRVVNVKGYSLGNVAFPRRGYGYEGLGEVYKNSVNIVEFTGNFPQNYSEYYDIRGDYFWTEIKITDVESGEEAEQIKQDIESIQGADKEEANLMAIEVYVKNAIIVVGDMPTDSDCRRGISLEAKKGDINFSSP